MCGEVGAGARASLAPTAAHPRRSRRVYENRPKLGLPHKPYLGKRAQSCSHRRNSTRISHTRRWLTWRRASPGRASLGLGAAGANGLFGTLRRKSQSRAPTALPRRRLARQNKKPGTPASKGARQTHLWWRRGDSNPRPLPCEGSALPAELRPQAHRASVIVAAPTSTVKRQSRARDTRPAFLMRRRPAGSTSRRRPPQRAARQRARS